ncbi:MAG: twin-arginine translocase subunit TatC [Thermodesulfobacteriota bacterium]
MTSAFAGITPHLDELRRRLITSFVTLGLTSAAAFAFNQELVRFLIRPLFQTAPNLSHLVYTHLTEAFISSLKVAILAGVVAAVPVFLHQLWLFIAPGLYRHERRLFGGLLLISIGFFLAGAAFAYLILLPQSLRLLLAVDAGQLTALPRLEDYLAFVGRLTLGCGLAFELPFLVVAVTRTGIVRRSWFGAQRWLILGSIFVIALLLAGGDPFAASLLFLPLWALYEAGLLLSRLLGSPA